MARQASESDTPPDNRRTPRSRRGVWWRAVYSEQEGDEEMSDKDQDKKWTAIIERIFECKTLEEARELQRKLPIDWREEAEEIIQCRKEEAV
jgi:hypothetical protein